MRRNDKGFTLIELVLGLSLIVLIILPVFGVIMGYKNKEIIESNKADLNSFKSKVLTTIENDIVKKGIQYTCEYIEEQENNHYFSVDTKQRLMFRDDTYADIHIDYEQKSIIYTIYDKENNKIDSNTFVIPVFDASLEDKAYIQDKTGNGFYDYFYIYKPGILKKYTDGKDHEGDNKSTILKIFIPITYEDRDYSIVITSPFAYTIEQTDGRNICGSDDSKGHYCPYSDKDSYTTTDGVFTCTNNFLDS